MLNLPVAQETEVEVRSSDSSIARVEGPVRIPAGSQVASFGLTTDGNSGMAEIRFAANGQTLIVRVFVGILPPEGLPVVVAPAVGTVVRDLSVRSNLILQPTMQQRITVPVLQSPALAPTPVAISSSDSTIVNVSEPVSIASGSQLAEVLIRTGASGFATLRLEANGDVLVLRVFVGTTPAEGVPLVVAPMVGAVFADIDRITAPVAITYPLRLRLLDAPTADPISVEVVSDDISIVEVVRSPVVISAGDDSVDFTLLTVAEGETRIRFCLVRR